MTNSVFLDRFAQFCISSDQNVLADGCPVVIEAQYIPNALLASPIVPDKPIEIRSTRYLDQMFTAGSVLNNMIRTFFACCPRGANLTVIPRLDAAGATAAVYEWPIIGTASTPGAVTIYWGESQWNVSLLFPVGATNIQIAQAIVAHMAGVPSFPYAVTDDGAGKLILTAKNAGTVGNNLAPVVNWAGRLDAMPAGIQFAPVTLATPGAGNPLPIDYATVLGTCCYTCYALGTDDPTWQEGLRDYLDSRWDCSKPMCFGHGFTYNTGTLGQILATWDNQTTLSSMARPLNPRTLPYLDLAGQVALRCCKACNNCEISVQGPEYGNLSCVRSPQTCSTEWADDEMAQLEEYGYTVLLPVSGGQGAMTPQFIKSDTTRYVYDADGRRNITWRDVNARYCDAAVMKKFGEFLKRYNGIALATRNTKIKIGVRAITLNALKAEIINHFKAEVGLTISEFSDINRDIVVLTDEQRSGACIGEPGVVYVKVQYQRLNRIVRFEGAFEPKMFDNCDRDFSQIGLAA